MANIRETRGPDWVQLAFVTPVLKVAVLRELMQRLQECSTSGCPLPLILCSEHPTIFLAGAHLREISDLDMVSSANYAQFGRRVLDRIANFPCPTIAAIGASVSGGGFDLVLSCDVVVTAPSATFSHPGVTRGLVTGWGGSLRLPLSLGGPLARQGLLEGSALSASELCQVGIVRDLDDQPVQHARSIAKRLRSIHPARLQTWRTLRDGRDLRTLRPNTTRAIIY